jgi:hypothetical protein
MKLKHLLDASEFFQRSRELRTAAGVSARDLWCFRSHALRIGEKPLGLFFWMCSHPEIARQNITCADEDDARSSWKELTGRWPTAFDDLAQSLAIGAVPDADARLQKIRALRQEGEAAPRAPRVRVAKHRRRRAR